MDKKKILAMMMATTLSATAFAETETEETTAAPDVEHQTDATKYNMENGVIPIADDPTVQRRQFRIQTLPLYADHPQLSLL